MNYCGIDLSLTGTGIAVLGSDCKRKRTFLITSTPGDQVETRIINIFEEFSKAVKLYKVFKFNIEGLAFGLRGQRMFELAGLHYYFRAKLTERLCSFVVTPPTSLKKYVTGVGNSKKNLMLLSVYKRWGEEFKDDNVADAYGLARMICDNNLPS